MRALSHRTRATGRLRARLAVTAVSALSAAAAVAAPAQADVIAYVADDDVHVVRPDGSGDRPVTSDGAPGQEWTSVAIAPDGTLWAARDGRLHHLTQGGTALGSVPVPDLPDVLDEAFDLAVSPDGSKLALTEVGASCEAGCSGPLHSAVVSLADGRVLASWPGTENLSWAGDGRLFGVGGAAQDFALFGTDGSRATFYNSTTADVSDVALAPGGRSTAWVGYVFGGFYVVSGRTSGDPATADTGVVSSVCAFGPIASTYTADPVFSPDGRDLAYAGPNGIQVATGAVPASDADCGGVAERTIGRRGASGMDWRAVTYDPSVPAPTGGGTTGGGGSTGGGSTGGRGGTGGGGGQAGAVRAAGGRLLIGRDAQRRARLRRGRATVRLGVGGPATLRVRLSSGRTTIATGRARATRTGRVTVRLSRAGHRALAALRGRRALLITATASTPGAERLEASRTVRVR